MIKKFILLVAMLVIAGGPVSSQTMKEVKKYNKEIQKQAKKKAKELSKEGYQCLGSGDMTYLLEQHISKVRFGHQELIGKGSSSSENLAKWEAIANAKSNYATLQSSSVKGSISTNDAELDGKVSDQILAAFKVNVESLLKDELFESLVLRRVDKKRYYYQVFYVVDHETAHALHMMALNMALDELELTEKYASKVSTWLD